jgi:hypothetical protein
MQSSLQTKAQILCTIRLWLSLFILGLVLSGLTAFPLVHETSWLASFLHANPILPSSITSWIAKVQEALCDTGLRYPFLAYGTDWLAFAHLVLAIAFLGPLRDPVRNKWVLQFGVMPASPLSSSPSSLGQSAVFRFYGDLSIAVSAYSVPSLCSFASAS